MAAIISVQAIEGAARAGAVKAGSTLHAGLVTGLEPADGGAAGLVAEDGAMREVWVGIRYQFLVGECDCVDADPQATSDDYLDAAAQGDLHWSSLSTALGTKALGHPR
jgi:hypothetical protein